MAADITNLQKPDAAERTTTSATLAEVTQRTIAWADLTGAGFAASDDVFIILTFGLDSNSGVNRAFCNFGHGTTFAGRTDFFPVSPEVETQDVDALVGGRYLGWVIDHTLVVNELFYFSLAIPAASTARSANFNVTIIKKGDLAVGDWRYDTKSSAIALDATYATGRDAQITLPGASGDDWLIIAGGDFDPGNLNQDIQQQINIDGVDTVMTTSNEPEIALEQFPFINIYALAAAAASQTVTFEAREEVGGGGHVLDRSFVLALRLEAFADHILLTDTTTDALSITPDTYVETGTVDLSLTVTGDVFVIGQSIIGSASVNTDPYLRLQEGGADIIAAMGRASAHSHDVTNDVGIETHVIGNMTSGTKTIDMDVAQDKSTAAANAIERTLVAFSLDLAAAGSTALLRRRR